MTTSDNIAIVPPATLAVIGLGKMGLPMSRQLLKAGFRVRGFDPVQAARTEFAGFGGTAAGSAGEAARSADAVITLLPDGRVVRQVMLGGPQPVADAMTPGAILLEMSSSAPLGTVQLGAALVARGIGVVDAPVSGGVKRAETGTLSIMLGGEGPALSRVRPILDALGTSVFETGPLGSGHAMKALNNYVSAAGLVAACEAVLIGKRFGLDPSLMVDILNASTGRNNSTENKIKQFVLSETFGSGFGLSLMAKDVETARDLADQLEQPAPLSHAVADLVRDAAEMLGSTADHTEVIRYLRKLAPTEHLE